MDTDTTPDETLTETRQAVCYSVAEAAERLGCSQQRVRQLCADGTLATERIGKFLLVSAASVAERKQQRDTAAADSTALLAEVATLRREGKSYAEIGELLEIPQYTARYLSDKAK